MSLFLEQLGKINFATNKAEREAAVEAAVAEIDKVTGDEGWDAYNDYGPWVRVLPQLIKGRQKRAKKHLMALIDINAFKNKIFTEDKPEKLLLKIKRCKSIEELNALESVEMAHDHPLKHKDDDGKKSIFHFSISIEDRIEHLVTKRNLADNGSSLRIALAEQKKYLTAKHTADKWAWPLTIVLCMLGIGVVCGIAMLVALPALIGVVGLLAAVGGIGYLSFPPLCSFIKRCLSADNEKWAAPISIALSVLVAGLVCSVAIAVAWPIMGIVGFLAASAVIGYVEIPVYYSFIKRSLRNIYARGIFQAIDNNLLNQLAKEEGKKDRHEFGDSEKDEKLNSGATWWWRRLKYALTSVGGLLTLISTVGFVALTYTQILEVLPLIGITAGFGMIAIPCFFAIASIPIFYVLFDNIFRAIKNNIFGQIWEQIKLVYYMEGFTKASGWDQFVHLAICFGKSIPVALTLAIVFSATLFSAGAWLQGSVNFFARTLGMSTAIAEKIGMMVGSIQLATNLGFNFENCFKTIGRFGDIIKNGNKGVRFYFHHLSDRVKAEPFVPKKMGIAVWGVLRLVVKYGPLLLHIMGVGMLSAQGTEAFILKPFFGGSETASVAVAASTQAICEGLEDSHTLMHDHSHEECGHSHHGQEHQEHKKHDKHEHADPAADSEKLTEKLVSLCDNAITFFANMGKPAEVIEPAPEQISISIKP